jgi:hypothetical protein
VVLGQASACRQVQQATVLTCADRSQQLEKIQDRMVGIAPYATNTAAPQCVLCWHALQGYCCSQSGFCSKTPAACDGTCQVPFLALGKFIGCRLGACMTLQDVSRLSTAWLRMPTVVLDFPAHATVQHVDCWLTPRAYSWPELCRVCVLAALRG